MNSGVVALSISCALLLAPGMALAQSTDVDARAQSVALMREAEQLAIAGNNAEACAKYEASYSLDAQLDALLPWANCLEQSGRLASAYAAFYDAFAIAQRTSDGRGPAAQARADKLRPRLSYLTIDVPQARRLPALSIERDGFRVGTSGWGVPIAVDPGSHLIVVRAYGYREWQTTIEVRSEAAAPYVEVPLLEKLAPQAAPPVPVPAPVAAEPVVSPPPPAVVAPPARPAAAPAREPSGLGPKRIAALVAGGVAVVSLGVGIYFAAKTGSTLSERDSICPSSKDCAPGTNARLADLTNKAISSQRTEIVFFVIASASAATGAGLWLYGSPSSASAKTERAAVLSPVVYPGGASLLLQGSL